LKLWGRASGCAVIELDIVDAELAQMTEVQLVPTRSRSVLGVMNDFARLLEFYRRDTDNLSVLRTRLAETPCGPLYTTHISPDRAVAAMLAGRSNR
ncbi:MAG: hypothetical protein LC792_25440, partial [Actinobacteria bacterium]|nr:hypothetical protein [Actinomycetota bacterium]